MPRQPGSAPTCIRCGLRAGRLSVSLDAAGVCNYCRAWERHPKGAFGLGEGRMPLEARLESYRGRFHYDAAVGLSGGKDSSHVLLRLSRDYGARVVAVTFDNGFLTESAWDNVREIARRLDVDHFVYRPDWAAYREFYRAAVSRLADPCIACSVGGYVLSVRGCQDMRIPFFVHGRSPMQMYRHLRPGSRDPGLALLALNTAPYSQGNVRRAVRRVEAQLRWPLGFLLPHLQRRRLVRQELFGSGRARTVVEPEFLAFYLFEPYDEAAILDELEGADIGYRRPPGHRPLGHDDCLIHDAAAYLYEIQHGVPRLSLEVAALVRQGRSTLEHARTLLEQSRSSEDAVDRSIGHLVERLDVRRADFDVWLDGLKRRRVKALFG
ncbi:MAG: hypothetical protein AB1778_07585 [Candidatus Bipolaricaulota bacterium]